MQKRVIQLIVIGIIVLSVVSAQTNSTNSTGTTDAVSKAYSCLESRVSNSSTLSLQEKLFSAIALGNKNGLYDKLLQEKKSPEGCWPKAGCTLKDSAQATIALDRMGVNTEEVANWMIGKNKSAQELTWYLEIDVAQQKRATCTLKYRTENRDVTVREDMKIEGEPGSCLSISPNGYWLEVRKTCYGQEIAISCSEDFISTLVFERSGTGTIFVIPETHSAAASGTTTEKVDAQCLGTGTGCDYEGTLWAASALQKTGKSVANFIPYLSALSEDKAAFFPSAFLYMLSGSNDEYTKIVQSMIQGKYWKASGTPYNQYYDSALGLLSLSSNGASEADAARNYFLSIQTKEGCWNSNNIRDTAFLLYAGWPREAVKVGGGSGGGGNAPQSCTSAGKYCGAQMACLDAGGQVLSSYTCSGVQSCCSVDLSLKTCTALNGNVCASNQECTGSTAPSSDGTCCIATCRNREVVVNACEELGGSCKTSCDTNEEETTDSCGESSGICCMLKESGGFPWGWIIALLVLIILVALGIIYRAQLMVYWLKMKGKISTQPVQPASPFSRGPGPGIGVPPGRPGYMTQRMPSQPSYPARRAAPSSQDKDMDETLRKLRDIGEGK